MIIETWSLDVTPGKNAEAHDWCKRIAAANAKQQRVVMARAFTPQTGGIAEFHRVVVEVDFQSMADREAYYNDGLSDEIQAVMNENINGEYTEIGKYGHHYYSVIE